MSQSVLQTEELPWLSVSCPKCHAILEIDGDWPGQQVQCNSCQSSVTLPEIADPALSECKCPWCNTHAVFLGYSRNRKIWCPSCHAALGKAEQDAVSARPAAAALVGDIFPIAQHPPGPGFPKAPHPHPSTANRAVTSQPVAPPPSLPQSPPVHGLQPARRAEALRPVFSAAATQAPPESPEPSASAEAPSRRKPVFRIDLPPDQPAPGATVALPSRRHAGAESATQAHPDPDATARIPLPTPAPKGPKRTQRISLGLPPDAFPQKPSEPVPRLATPPNRADSVAHSPSAHAQALPHPDAPVSTLFDAPGPVLAKASPPRDSLASLAMARITQREKAAHGIAAVSPPAPQPVTALPPAPGPEAAATVPAAHHRSTPAVLTPQTTHLEAKTPAPPEAPTPAGAQVPAPGPDLPAQAAKPQSDSTPPPKAAPAKSPVFAAPTPLPVPPKLVLKSLAVSSAPRAKPAPQAPRKRPAARRAQIIERPESSKVSPILLPLEVPEEDRAKPASNAPEEGPIDSIAPSARRRRIRKTVRKPAPDATPTAREPDTVPESEPSPPPAPSLDTVPPPAAKAAPAEDAAPTETPTPEIPALDAAKPAPGAAKGSGVTQLLKAIEGHLDAETGAEPEPAAAPFAETQAPPAAEPRAGSSSDGAPARADAPGSREARTPETAPGPAEEKRRTRRLIIGAIVQKAAEAIVPKPKPAPPAASPAATTQAQSAEPHKIVVRAKDGVLASKPPPPVPVSPPPKPASKSESASAFPPPPAAGKAAPAKPESKRAAPKSAKPKPAKAETPKPAKPRREKAWAAPWLFPWTPPQRIAAAGLAVAALAGGAALSFTMVRNHQIQSAGFTDAADFKRFKEASRLLARGRTDDALRAAGPRAVNPASDPALKAFFFPVRARLGKPPLSISEVAVMAALGPKAAEVAGRTLAWEAAYHAPGALRLDAIEFLASLERSPSPARDTAATAPAKDSLPGLPRPEAALGDSPEAILGPRPSGIEAYLWDENAARWYGSKAGGGDEEARKRLLSWIDESENNRVRREAGCRALLALGEPKAIEPALKLYRDLVPSIAFRTQIAESLAPSASDPKARESFEPLRLWATRNLAEGAARACALLHEQGSPEGLALLKDGAKSSSLYSEMAIAAIRELARLLGEESRESIAAARQQWTGNLARLKVEGGASPSEENLTFQKIANKVLDNIEIELARAGDAETRDSMELRLERGNDFEKVRLALLWGKAGLDLATPMLVKIAGADPSGPTTAEVEQEEALSSLVECGNAAAAPLLLKSLVRPDPVFRYRAGLRLAKIALAPSGPAPALLAAPLPAEAPNP